MLPEVDTGLVLGIDMDMTAFDTGRLQGLQAAQHKLAANPFSPVRINNRQVINRAAAAIMPT